MVLFSALCCVGAGKANLSCVVLRFPLLAALCFVPGIICIYAVRLLCSAGVLLCWVGYVLRVDALVRTAVLVLHCVGDMQRSVPCALCVMLLLCSMLLPYALRSLVLVLLCCVGAALRM